MYSRIQAACDIKLAMFFDVLWISPLILNDMEHTLKMKKKQVQAQNAWEE